MFAGLNGRSLRVTLAVTGGIAFILQGYDQALMNGLLTLHAFEETFPSIDTSTPEKSARNSTLQGMNIQTRAAVGDAGNIAEKKVAKALEQETRAIKPMFILHTHFCWTAVALYEVGAAIGALLCFVLGNYFGRKRTVLAAATLILIGVTIQASSYSLAQLIVARVITGIGVGGFTATLPTWVGESTEAAERGSLVLIQGSGAIFGVMFVSWIELGFYFVGNNPVSWRFPIAFQAIFPILVLGFVPFLPESPRWLVSKDRFEDGAQVLARLQGEKVESEAVTKRMAELRASIEADSQGHSNNPFARTPNRHLHRTLIAIAVNMLAQMSGVNIITFYANVVFENILGFPAVKTRVIVACLQTWQFLAATSAVFLIDRFGRRRLLLVCISLMAIAHAGLAGLQSHADNQVAAGCSLIFYFLALGAFPIGLFLIPFLFASEISPTKIRTQVAAMATATNWLFNFFLAEITPVAFDRISWKYYLVYVCVCSLGLVVFYLFVPETKGRSLEDIDAFFVGTKNVLQPVKVAKNMPSGVHVEYEEKERPSNAEHKEDVE